MHKKELKPLTRPESIHRNPFRNNENSSYDRYNAVRPEWERFKSAWKEMQAGDWVQINFIGAQQSILKTINPADAKADKWFELEESLLWGMGFKNLCIGLSDNVTLHMGTPMQLSTIKLIQRRAS